MKIICCPHFHSVERARVLCLAIQIDLHAGELFINFSSCGLWSEKHLVFLLERSLPFLPSRLEKNAAATNVNLFSTRSKILFSLRPSKTFRKVLCQQSFVLNYAFEFSYFFKASNVAKDSRRGLWCKMLFVKH